MSGSAGRRCAGGVKSPWTWTRTDDPSHGQQELSFFHGAYGQHMRHPLTISERHTAHLLVARLRPGRASSAQGVVAAWRGG
ncbi:MAG: transposase [Terriglobales bacterium]